MTMSKLPIVEVPIIERIARLLATQQAPAVGDAGGDWRQYIPRAAAVLHEIRVPDTVMAGAGDAEIWEKMIAAALHDDPGVTTETGATTEIRDAGPSQMSNPPSRWSKLDENSDESFPASDPPSFNPGAD